MPSSGTARYSDQELEEFRVLISKKLEHAKEQLQNLQDQILEITENTGDEHGGDWVDDSSTNSEVELLNTMAIRQRKFITDLENALIRIRNKTYGICVISGELIDKRRLMAVPTTTKSLMAKTEQNKQEESKTTTRLNQNPYVKKTPGKKAPKKIITKVIKKSGGPTKPVAPDLDDDDDDDYGFGPDLDDDLDLKISKNLSTEDLDLDEDDIADDEEDETRDDIGGFEEEEEDDED
jgi:RNA polymerase-binding transcription factor DksA